MTRALRHALMEMLAHGLRPGVKCFASSCTFNTAEGDSGAGGCHKKSRGVWQNGAMIGEQLQQVP